MSRVIHITVPQDKEDEIIYVLEDICHIRGIVRYKAENGHIVVVHCGSTRASKVLGELDKIGCGCSFGIVSLMSLEALKPYDLNRVDDHDDVDQPDGLADGRLSVEEIYSKIVSGAAFNFDFLVYVIVAGCIAGVGLATNNTVMIVAAMLVSPLMGPILAIMFGTVILDKKMVKSGLRDEAIGTLVTFAVGMVLGVLCIPLAHQHLDWPTAEMQSRGDAMGLLVGLCFAIPSGGGVAVAVTGGGVNSLVGVAISASLLPPVINSGMCLVYGLFAPLAYPDENIDGEQFLYIAGISMVLFIMNVVVIYLVGMGIFRLKDIVPIAKTNLWNELPKVRATAQTLRPWALKEKSSTLRRVHRPSLELEREKALAKVAAEVEAKKAKKKDNFQVLEAKKDSDSDSDTDHGTRSKNSRNGSKAVSKPTSGRSTPGRGAPHGSRMGEKAAGNLAAGEPGQPGVAPLALNDALKDAMALDKLGPAVLQASPSMSVPSTMRSSPPIASRPTSSVPAPPITQLSAPSSTLPPLALHFKGTSPPSAAECDTGCDDADDSPITYGRVLSIPEAEKLEAAAAAAAAAEAEEASRKKRLAFPSLLRKKDSALELPKSAPIAPPPMPPPSSPGKRKMPAIWA